MKVCVCGIKFNPDTTGGTEKCPICFQNLIFKQHQSKEIFKEYVRPFTRQYTEIYIATGIVAKTKRKYLKLYQKLERWREYKKNWTRKKRQEDREKYGKIQY